jgi:hypothetical protein
MFVRVRGRPYGSGSKIKIESMEQRGGEGATPWLGRPLAIVCSNSIRIVDNY